MDPAPQSPLKLESDPDAQAWPNVEPGESVDIDDGDEFIVEDQPGTSDHGPPIDSPGIMELYLSGLYVEDQSRKPPAPGTTALLRSAQITELTAAVRRGLADRRVTLREARAELDRLSMLREAAMMGGQDAVAVKIADDPVLVRPLRAKKQRKAKPKAKRKAWKKKRR